MTARLPSLLDHVREVRERLRPPALIALDFDGTLTEIVDDPTAPRLTADRQDVLTRILSSGCRLAIVSGRALADVRERTAVAGAVYVGNHGLEIEGPRIQTRPRDYTDLAARLARVLDALPAIEGAFIENKGVTATVHVRPRNDEGRITSTGTTLREPVEAAGLELRRGRASWEIRPPGQTKGDALRRLIEVLEAHEGKTLYAGDDATDEDAFHAIPRGITVRIGEPDVETAARYVLPDPAALYAFLDQLPG